MKIENGSLEECPCVSYRILSPGEQLANDNIKNRMKNGEDIRDVQNTLCGECVYNSRIQRAIERKNNETLHYKTQ